jgi:hypothetical protein
MMESQLLMAGPWTGQLRNVEKLGAAFAPLCHHDHGEHSLYGDGGLNFEHIFNGTAADHDAAWFTPRTDAHHIDTKSDATAFIVHDAPASTWAAESRMTYTLTATGVDLQFRVRFHEERFPLGWIGMMWASYMAGAQDRRLHFYGTCDGVEGWTCLGEETEEGFETGTVAALGVEALPVEEGAALLNVVENPRKRFLDPVCYGLLDDGHAYVMMFDHTEAIRLAMWNFVEDESGNPDPARPAWDWQFVVREPELHHWYGYRARILVVPFTTADDIRRLYLDWSGDRG